MEFGLKDTYCILRVALQLACGLPVRWGDNGIFLYV